jgi:D-3-phosphoglycerate dehydrogenase
MDAPVALVHDLVAWVAERPRTYRETMDAWRTSCPKLPVWEDAIESGLVVSDGLVVTITDAGRALLTSRRT